MTTKLQPTDIYAYLSQKVLGQEEVLKQISVSVYKHIKGIKWSNILLIGNSGTGKTTIMNSVFEFYLAHQELADYQTMLVMNANSLTDESGEVHINRIFKNLEADVRNRMGSGVSPRELKTHIENATVCLDEIDKISAKISDRVNVTGILIQQALLTILEGEIFYLETTISRDKKKLPIRITTKTSNNFLIVKDTELEVREVTMNFSVDLEALYELFVDKDRVYIASGKLTAESKLGTHHHEFYTFLHYAIIDEIFVELQQPEPNWERIKNIVRQKLSVVWHDFTIASVDLNRYMTRVQLEKNLSKRAPESIAPKDFREFARRLTEALIVFPGITNKKMQAILAKRHMAFIDLRMSKYYWVFFVPFMPREVIHYNYCMALYYHYLKSLLKEKNIRGDIETCKILKLFELISIDD